GAHEPCLLRQRELLPELVSNACLLDCVPMQIGHAHGDALAARVIPRSAADTVTRVDGAGTLSAEIRMPGCGASACRSRHHLAICVGACQAAVIGAVAFTHACDKEAHRLLRTAAPSFSLLRDQGNGAQSEHHGCSKNCKSLFHRH